MKPSNNSKVIIILGPPGSGKGTQGELLASKFNLYHFETSRILESKYAAAKKGDFVKVGGKKYFLLDEKKIRDSGKWNSPPLVAFWVKEKIKALAREGKGIVMSGSPKTVYEAGQETPLFKKLYGSENIKVILIKQKPEVSIFRNSKRKICELMRHSILYSKENEKLTKCPIDGSNFILREDTDPKVIKSKLEQYQTRALPVLDYFKKQGLKIKEINGEKSVVEVFNDILKALNGR